jgi:TonB-linked SusC/RagA family outer membrane protein
MTRVSWKQGRQALAVLGMLAGSASLAAAQNAVISGRVTSDQGRPLAGANVFITELNLSVGTSEAGNYTLTVQGARVRGQTVVLRARAIGQKPDAKSIVLRPGTIRQDFVLAQDVNRLSQVVVTGVTGATEQVKVPFAVARVDEKDMPVAGVNPLTQLQGKVPGANIVSNSGRPGAQPAVLLRGPTSINASGRGQDPLYIVDGVILQGPLPDLNSLDIESVEVVKGAAGASLYGARAGNGVIQITTKSGRGLGDNTVRFGFRTEVGGGDIEREFPLAVGTPLQFNENKTLQCEAGAAGNGFTAGYFQPCVRVVDIYTDALRINQLGTTEALAPRAYRYDAGIAAAPGRDRLVNMYQLDRFPVQYDPIGATVSNGLFANSNVDMTGKFAGANFFASVSNTTQQGSIQFLNGLTRNTVRLNVSQNFGSKWTAAVNTFYSRLEQDGLNQSGSETGGTTGFFALTRVPGFVNLERRDAFGRLFVRPNPNAQGGGNGNPLYSFSESRRNDARDRFLGNIDVKYQPTTWLDFQGQFGYDRSNGEVFQIQDRGFRTLGPDFSAASNGFIFRVGFNDQSYNASFNTTARKSFGRLNTKATLRYLYEQQDFRSLSNSGDNIPFPGLFNSGALIQNLGIGSGEASIRQIGMFANLDFDYADRYIVSGLIRRDGSSLFGRDNRWATFGRGSVAWRIAMEPWWGIKAVNEFKIRASIGTAGGRPSFPAQYESFAVGTGGVINPTLLGNRLLGPEVNTETELGLDLELFNKYGLTVNYAQSNVRDQILPVPVPTVSGFGTQWRNAGTLQNKTWEASLNVPLITRPDLSWSVRVNYDRVRSRITELDVPEFTGGVGLQAAENVFLFREGERLGTFYGRDWVRNCAQLPASFASQCGARGSGSQYEVDNQGFVVWTGGLAQDSGFTRNYWTARNPGASSPWGQQTSWGMPILIRDTAAATFGSPTNVVLGNTIPNYRWSIANTFSWKRLNVYGLLDASMGQRVWNQGYAWSLGDFMTQEQDQFGRSVTDAKPMGYTWRAPAGTIGGHPAGVGGFYDVLAANGYTTFDASYARLREVSVTYRVGRVLGAGNWTVGVVGRNLLTFTNYTGFDPETGLSGGQLGSPVLNGVDRYAFPNLRTFTFSIGSTF